MTVRIDISDHGIAHLWLARPQVRNAFNAELIDDLQQALGELEQDDRVRLLILGGDGAVFCAGADLAWMQRARDLDPAENLADARRLAGMFHRLNRFAKPTIARVQGAAMGGGVGLAACCDIAICADDAVFALSEVRLGLIPAVISPFVLAAIGARAARRLFLSAERFDAKEASRIGLIHQIAAAGALDDAVAASAARVLKGGPNALVAAKTLIFDIAGRPIDAAVLDDVAGRIADLRASAEGLAGIDAFIEKRPPDWQKE